MRRSFAAPPPPPIALKNYVTLCNSCGVLFYITAKRTLSRSIQRTSVRQCVIRFLNASHMNTFHLFHQMVSPRYYNYIQYPCAETAIPTSAAPILIDAGPSSVNSKGLLFHTLECPSVVDKYNWLNTETYDDTFEITVSGPIVTARRTDSDEGWALNLQFHCTGVYNEGKPRQHMCPNEHMIACSGIFLPYIRLTQMTVLWLLKSVHPTECQRRRLNLAGWSALQS